MTLQPRCSKFASDLDSRGVAQIVGVGFERESQDSDGPAFEDFQLGQQFFDHALALPEVDLAGCRDDRHAETVFGRGGDQRRRIFPKTGAAPTEAGLQESSADARIQADSLGHLQNVRADFFGQVADLIDVADLQREESIGGVLDQFGRSQIGGDQRNGAQALRAAARNVGGLKV